MMNLLQIDGVTVNYGKGARTVKVLLDVSLDLPAGRIVGIVGESGSGKSTLARAIAGLVPVSAGTVSIGETTFGPRRPRKDRRRVQMAFQDPSTSLNPRMTVEQTLRDACEGSRAAKASRIDELLLAVGLDDRHRRSFPADLSGGQRQRVSLARALAADPDVLICDEVTSALDAPTRFSILSLLADLQRDHQFTLLFISHDIGAVRQICDDIAVMYAGQLVEVGAVADVIADPQHPYTRVLLDSVPSLDREFAVVPVDFEPVDPRDPPTGCRFNPRCPVGPSNRDDRTVCVTSDPTDDAASRLHRSACHFSPPSSDLGYPDITTSALSTNRAASAGSGTDASPPSAGEQGERHVTLS